MKEEPEAIIPDAEDLRSMYSGPDSPAYLHSKNSALLAINRISHALHNSLDYQTVAENAVDVMMSYCQSPSVGIFEYDDEEKTVNLIHAKGFSERTLTAVKKMPIDGSLSGVTVRKRDIVISTDMASDDRYHPEAKKSLLEEGKRCVVSIPLFFQERVVGVMNMIFNKKYILKDYERDTLLSIGKTIGLAMVNARHVANLEARKDSLRALNDELKSIYRELEDFSFSISHDLRTPLRAIDGFSSILEDKYLEHSLPEARRCINIIRSNSQKMGKLLDGLQEFLNINQKALRRTAISPLDIIRGLIAYQIRLHGERKIEFSFGDMPVCNADPEMMKIVFSHLISNAIKYTRKCDVARIEMGHLQNNGEGAYFIRDNGVGFDMRYADKVFRVYQRLHSTGEYEGIGLGMALTKHIIRQHGGRIWTESEPGKGTAFFFTLPLSGKEQTDPPG
jgi:signal transduction histidine kinase